MKDVYREVSHWRRLLPRERDVVTGRREGFRDDKREDDPQADRSQQSQGSGDGGAGGGLLGTGVPVGTAALVAAAVVVALGAGGLGVRALVSDDGDDPPSAVSTSGPGGAPGGAVAGSGAPTASGGAGVPVPVQSEPPATAIQLEYTGGSFVRRECTDLSGEGECEYYADPIPLSVYCTADGCTLYHFGTGSIDGPLSLKGRTSADTEGCQQTSWTLDFTPVGVAVTQGLRHPARITGTMTQSRPAELLPDGTNCLGGDEVYRYDASPS
ncbi:hypothetical protein [Oryzobacter terrae]|uniref:hypothetical protein n=1 Tax=Oryzobacter terrae TaxID=1620385 RepID=UPI003672E57B